MACHLLKAVECWTDLGLGNFELRYLRDKLKREVDFLVVRDRKPWMLVEVKTSDTRLSDSLRYFQTATKAKHAFQAVFELPHVQADCFRRTDAAVVPARTLLSQLLTRPQYARARRFTLRITHVLQRNGGWHAHKAYSAESPTHNAKPVSRSIGP